MFIGTDWLTYLKWMAAVVALYYLALAIIYNKELLHWWRNRKK